jgi:hypothetical protein
MAPPLGGPSRSADIRGIDKSQGESTEALPRVEASIARHLHNRTAELGRLCALIVSVPGGADHISETTPTADAMTTFAECCTPVLPKAGIYMSVEIASQVHGLDSYRRAWEVLMIETAAGERLRARARPLPRCGSGCPVLTR